MDSRIPAALGICPTDTRLVQFINEATQRLITEGNFWGLFARFRCTADEGEIVWPRQIASILSASVSEVPIKTRNQWWEFIEQGLGIQDECNDSMDMIDHGTTPVMEQITGNTYNVRVYRDVTSDEGIEVLLLGYDENGNWIRTVQDGEWKDGEIVAATALGAISTKIFSVISAVQKPVTDGTIRLYSYDPATATNVSLLAAYDYDETRPSYRISYVPSLDRTASSTCTVTVEVMVKLAYVPVRNPTDYLLISCIPALKTMCEAIAIAEKETVMSNKVGAIEVGLASAKKALEKELQHYSGAPDEIVSVQGAGGVTRTPIEALI